MKLEVFIIKILKKKTFCHKNLVDFRQTQPNFQLAILDMLKMTLLLLSHILGAPETQKGEWGGDVSEISSRTLFWAKATSMFSESQILNNIYEEDSGNLLGRMSNDELSK